MPPLIGFAVNVKKVPAHADNEFAVIDIAGVTRAFTRVSSLSLTLFKLEVTMLLLTVSLENGLKFDHRAEL